MMSASELVKKSIGKPQGFPELDSETGKPVDESKGFTIDSDALADWAIKTIRMDEEDSDRLIKDIKDEVALLEARILEEEEKKERKTSFLRFKLEEYFQSVPRKSTKTQESYRLPAGTLVLKKGGYAYEPDNDELVDWLEANGKGNLVKTAKKADWAALKKGCSVEIVPAIDVDGNVIDGMDTFVLRDEDGKEVKGVKVSQNADTFDIK